MEYMKAMEVMQMKQGMASVNWFHSILATCCVMKKPTTMRAGAVANEGMVRKRGEKKRDSKNSAPVTMAVRPVLPPSAMPAEDSTKVVMVEVPNMAPMVVPTESARSAPLIPGSFPS